MASAGLASSMGSIPVISASYIQPVLYYVDEPIIGCYGITIGHDIKDIEPISWFCMIIVLRGRISWSTHTKWWMHLELIQIQDSHVLALYPTVTVDSLSMHMLINWGIHMQPSPFLYLENINQGCIKGVYAGTETIN